MIGDLRRMIDGMPVPVCAVSRMGRPGGSSADQQWLERGAASGRCAAREWFFGFTPTLTATVDLPSDNAALIAAAGNEREAAAAQDPAERAFLVHIRDRNETLIGLLTSEYGREDPSTYNRRNVACIYRVLNSFSGSFARPLTSPPVTLLPHCSVRVGMKV